MSERTEQMREAFIKWHGDNYKGYQYTWSTRDGDGFFLDARVGLDWGIWQAAQASTPQPQSVREDEPVRFYGNDWVSDVILKICELSDRNSPEDFPEAMVVTPAELRQIIATFAPKSLIEPLSAATGGQEIQAKTAKQQYEEYMGEHVEKSPIERMRFFCSLAMNGQDWLDSEPFFDDLSTGGQESEAQAVAKVTVGNADHGPFRFEETPYGFDRLPDGETYLFAALTPQPENEGKE